MARPLLRDIYIYVFYFHCQVHIIIVQLIKMLVKEEYFDILEKVHSRHRLSW